MTGPAFVIGAFLALSIGLALGLVVWLLLAGVEDVEWDDDTEAEDRIGGAPW